MPDSVRKVIYLEARHYVPLFKQEIGVNVAWTKNLQYRTVLHGEGGEAWFFYDQLRVSQHAGSVQNSYQFLAMRFYGDLLRHTVRFHAVTLSYRICLFSICSDVLTLFPG